MRRHLSFIAAAAAAGLLATAALAQTAAPARTFDQLAAMDLRLTQDQKKTPAAGDLFFNPGQDTISRTAASFTGQWRPLDSRKQAFIVAFGSTGPGNEGYARLYQREYLFRSGSQDYWLPVQLQVASFFTRELKAGEEVTLYVRNAGGFRDQTAWQWVFLVEEFENGKTPKAPPPKGKPVIPDGPKTQT